MARRLESEYFPERLDRLGRLVKQLTLLITRIDLAWARLIQDDEQILEDLLSIGSSTADLGDIDEASTYFARAKSEASGTPYEAVVMRAVYNLAVVWFRREAWERVISELEPELPRLRRLRNRQLVADGLRDLGIAYEKLGQPSRALAMYAESLDVATASRDGSRRALAMRNLGGIPYQRGRWEEACRYWADALALFRELRDRRGTAMMAYYLGLASRRLGRRDEARRLFEESYALYRRLGVGDLAARSQVASNQVPED
jgi:tetratricopeptide (TPR) repeat protein